MKAAFEMASGQLEIEFAGERAVPKFIERARRAERDEMIVNANNCTRILIADDDRQLSSLLAARISDVLENRVEIHTVDTVERAIDVLQGSALFSIAIVDLNFGIQGSKAGLQIVSAVRARSYLTKLFIFTGYDVSLEPGEILTLGQSGGTEHLMV